MRLRTPIKVGETGRRIQPKLPAWILEGLDRVAENLGITRDAVIKVWLAERLQAEGFVQPKIKDVG